MIIVLLCVQFKALAQYGGNAPTVCVIDATDQNGQSLGTAGKGFALKVGGRDILITTAHGICEIYGPTAEPSTSLDKIGSVVLRNFAEKEIATAGKCLSVGTRDAGYATDLLAFELPPGVQMQSMYLSPSLPAKGMRVWVLSKEGANFSTNPAVDKYPGTVESATNSALNVRLDRALTAYHSSGSPVIDSKNQVVGMLCGISDDRKNIGCSPCLAIWQRLGIAPAPASISGTPSNHTTPAAPAARPDSGVKTYR